MNDQTTPDLEPRLAAWLATRAPTDVPRELRDRVAAIPDTVAVIEPALIRFRPRPNRRGWTLVLVAASVGGLLAAVAGGALPGTRMDRGTPQESQAAVVERPSADAPPSPSPTDAGESLSPVPAGAIVPAVVPPEIDHGTVSTPIGAARWVHLSGTRSAMPGPLVPQRALDGRLLWFDPGGPGAACYENPASIECTEPPAASLFVADDVLAPRQQVALPAQPPVPGDLFTEGDRYWFAPADASNVWTSTDLESWHPIDLAAVRSPGEVAGPWTLVVSPPERVADRWVITATESATDPGSLLGYPGRPVNLARDAQGNFVAREYHPRNDGGPVDLGPIDVTAGPEALEFRNAAGIVVGRVPGAAPEFADDWAKHGLQRTYVAVVDDGGDAWRPVDLPGMTPAMTLTTLAGIGNELWLFGLDVDDVVHAWQTSSGAEWDGGGPVVLDDGSPLRSNGVYWYGDAAGEHLGAPIVNGDAGWVSVDGRTWSRDPGTDAAPADRVATGFIRNRQSGLEADADAWDVSADGVTWEDAPEIAAVVTKSEPAGPGGAGGAVLENAYFFSVEEDWPPYARDLWVFDFGRP